MNEFRLILYEFQRMETSTTSGSYLQSSYKMSRTCYLSRYFDPFSQNVLAIQSRLIKRLASEETALNRFLAIK